MKNKKSIHHHHHQQNRYSWKKTEKKFQKPELYRTEKNHQNDQLGVQINKQKKSIYIWHLFFFSFQNFFFKKKNRIDRIEQFFFSEQWLSWFIFIRIKFIVSLCVCVCICVFIFLKEAKKMIKTFNNNNNKKRKQNSSKTKIRMHSNIKWK